MGFSSPPRVLGKASTRYHERKLTAVLALRKRIFLTPATSSQSFGVKAVAKSTAEGGRVVTWTVTKLDQRICHGTDRANPWVYVRQRANATQNRFVGLGRTNVGAQKRHLPLYIRKHTHKSADPEVAPR